MGHLSYWSEVFKRIGLRMTSDLHSNLDRLDKQKCWKRKYNSGTDVKLRRVKCQNEKMQMLLKQQVEDNKRGSIYRTGYGVKEDLMPKVVKEREQELRTNGKVMCPLFGCHGRTHKSDTSKLCFYHDCQKKRLTDCETTCQVRKLVPSYLYFYRVTE